MQEAFAACAEAFMEAKTNPDSPLRQRLDALIAYDTMLRGEADYCESPMG